MRKIYRLGVLLTYVIGCASTPNGNSINVNDGSKDVVQQMLEEPSSDRF